MYTEKEARSLIIEAGHRLLDEDLIARTWGNISARIGDDKFIITPSGRSYDNLREDELVIVNVEDCSYDGDIKPSSEKGVHAKIYDLRPEVNFIIHTHQFYASVIAADRQDTDFSPCAEYALPGTKKLIENISKVILTNPDKKSFLLASHGVVALGNDFDDAFFEAKKLEEASKKAIKKRIPDFDPEVEFDNGIDVATIIFDNMPNVSILRDPEIMECCRAGINVKPFLDDFAQIIGTDMLCIENDVKCAKKAVRKMKKNFRNAILVNGVGALVYADTQDDLKAEELIVRKNCAAACYARKSAPIKVIDALIQRQVYLKKYSKRING